MLCCTLGSAALLGGCTSFSSDGGMNAVNTVVTPALGVSVEKINADEGSGDAAIRIQRLLKSRICGAITASLPALRSRP